MPHRLITTCFAAVLVALATIAPVANAAGSRTHECQPSPAYWVSVTDEQGVPNLELVAGTTCTTAVTTIESCAAQRSPYPGWVQVVDEIGVPSLYKIGFEPTTSAPCLEPNAAQSTGAAAAVTATAKFNPLPPLNSPYAGWIVVFDEQGVPNLEPISQYR
jgi:hypothetical protein